MRNIQPIWTGSVFVVKWNDFPPHGNIVKPKWLFVNYRGNRSQMELALHCHVAALANRGCLWAHMRNGADGTGLWGVLRWWWVSKRFEKMRPTGFGGSTWHQQWSLFMPFLEEVTDAVFCDLLLCLVPQGHRTFWLQNVLKMYIIINITFWFDIFSLHLLPFIFYLISMMFLIIGVKMLRFWL